MPRFFFGLQLERLYPDDHGTDLPDENAARKIAVQMVSELVRNAFDELWRDGFRVFAEDEQRAPLFTLEVKAYPPSAGP